MLTFKAMFATCRVAMVAAATAGFVFGGVAVLAQTPAANASAQKPPKAAKANKAAKADKADKPAGPKKPEPLFASNDVIKLTIKAPFGRIMQNRDGSDPPAPGILTVAGSAEALDITLQPRGITRRKRETCSFAPMWLEFAGKPSATSVFKGQKKLKLVTHCRTTDAFTQYVLLEYAAYRLFNVLTPVSFNARLAKIEYVEADGRPVATRMGFFIEDGAEISKRNQLTQVKNVVRIKPSQLAPREATQFAMFQNMISNYDWAMTAGPPGSDCCHNSRLMGVGEATTGYIPTPYDFDFSGVVDAPYAVPPDKIKVSSVRVRRYRGYCIHNPELPAMAATFEAKRPQLLAVFDEIAEFDPSARSKATKFIDSFFEQITSPAMIAEKFEKVCL